MAFLDIAEINPQIVLPKEKMIYCQECKILLADGLLDLSETRKIPICNYCYCNIHKVKR